MSAAVLDLAEIMAGVTFLEVHAPPEVKGALEACSRAIEGVARQMRLDRVRDLAIDDVEVSIRTSLRLKGRGIKSLRALETLLTSKTDEQLRWMFKGELKTLKECREMLKTLGLKSEPSSQ